jgi:hypothetical protein
MMEKRKVERFNLQIETMLQVRNKAMTDKLPVLFSRDISCNGVFLVTDNPLSIGTSLDLDFLLSQDELRNESNAERIKISTSGKVIRTEEQGMAVEFEKQYKISRLKLGAEV